jgi:hypothetical protein
MYMYPFFRTELQRFESATTAGMFGYEEKAEVVCVFVYLLDRKILPLKKLAVVCIKRGLNAVCISNRNIFILTTED